jgi:hypothetical protein
MSRLWFDEEPITVTAMSTTAAETSHPLAFVWNSRVHTVERVIESWRLDADWWSDAGGVARVYFKLITKTGLLCEIYRDITTDAWMMAKIYD